MIENPKVSVCVVTYNHEKYIRECLESIVTQKCDFDFEVIVGEDCSTDNTRAIVQEYADKYPDIVKPLFHEKNVGASDNYIYVHEQAKGKYICHIDGDDYALPGKLQAQADFMDKTPDCNICFHRVSGLYNDGTIKDDLVDYEKIKDGFTRSDILMYMAVGANSSKMYRQQVINFEIPEFDVLDFYANIEQIENKKAYFVNDRIYGVYRIGTGISTSSKIIIKDLIIKTLYRALEKYPNEKPYINSEFLVLFMLDLKNKRDFKDYLYGYLKTFTLQGIFLTINTWKIRRMFRLGS
ncbi:glycosyltransferase family 2 protein [Arcobacter sp. YIC-80]|uniref:glycosyltransferase family 2 protein n=1 Tax=Arcobacter sp. YIC-80 TaxID=3376683 RepID=UPI003850A792